MESAITFQPFAFLNRHSHKGGKKMLASDCWPSNLDLQNDESHSWDQFLLFVELPTTLTHWSQILKLLKCAKFDSVTNNLCHKPNHKYLQWQKRWWWGGGYKLLFSHRVQYYMKIFNCCFITLSMVYFYGIRLFLWYKKVFKLYSTGRGRKISLILIAS